MTLPGRRTSLSAVHIKVVYLRRHAWRGEEESDVKIFYNRLRICLHPIDYKEMIDNRIRNWLPTNSNTVDLPYSHMLGPDKISDSKEG